jgi:transposase
VTSVRQRVTRERLGRRGRARDNTWAHRQLLLTGYEHLSAKQRHRFIVVLNTADSTNEIGTAHAVKERLRRLLATSDPVVIRRRLFDFYDAAANAHMPETTKLANTIQTWWPTTLVALTEQITNARIEGFNRIIKQTKRVACGFRNMVNYRRRILADITLTRGHIAA